MGAFTLEPISGSGSGLIPRGMFCSLELKDIIGPDNNSSNQRLNGLDMAGQSEAQKYASSDSFWNNFLMFSFIWAHLSPIV